MAQKIEQHDTDYFFLPKYLNICENKVDTNYILTLSKLSDDFRSSNLDSTAYYARKALLLAEKAKMTSIIPGCYRKIGSYYFEKKEYLAALEYYEKALKSSAKYGNTVELALAHYGLGLSNGILSNSAKSLQHVLEAAALFEKLSFVVPKMSSWWVYSNIIIAENYETQNDWKKSIEYYQRTICISDWFANHYGKAYSLSSLGCIYIKSGMHEQGFRFIRKAREVLKRLEYDPQKQIESVCLRCEGLAYLQEGELEKALYSTLAANELNITIGDFLNRAKSETQLLKIYLKMGRKDDISAKAPEILFRTLKLRTKQELMQIYSILSEFHEKNKEFERALEFNKLYTSYKDSIFGEESVKKIQMLEFEEQRKIEEANSKAAQLAKELRQEQELQYYQTWMAGILFAILAISAVSYQIFQRLRRKKILYELQARSLALEIQLKDQNLQIQNQELVGYALRLSELNDFFNEIRSMIQEDSGTSMANVVKKIDAKKKTAVNWNNFKDLFERLHPEFYAMLLKAAPSLTSQELKLCALLRINISSKEISSILNITPESVFKARYRLRKKLQIEEDENLVRYLFNL